MFNKKEIEPEKQDLTESCVKCKHLVLKSDMTPVKWRNTSYFENSGVEYYCPEHKPAYSSWESPMFSPRRYFKEMEVSEDGVPIGYIVAPKKEIKKSNG